MKRIKAEDYIGKTFGELTIQKIIKKNNRSYCLCKCSCGSTTEVVFSNLRTGNTTSCGDYSKHPRVKKENLINQKFNRLFVLQDSGEKVGSHTLWVCKCDCGNIIKVRGDYLKSGHTTSCGCILSKGEDKIAKILKDNGISFVKHRYEPNCIFPSNKGAFFDFYLEPDYNNKVYIKTHYYIEYDGIQHFIYNQNSIWNTKENLTKQKEYDKIKNEYCLKNNIPLIRIPYTHYDNLCLEDLLLETSEFLIEGENC